jgi:hypothetical protein
MPPPPEVAAVARQDGTLLAALAADAEDAVDGLVTPRVLADPERWRDGVATSAPRLIELQAASIASADQYLVDILAAQGADTGAVAELAEDAFLDMTDGGGSWLRNLVYAPPSAYRDALDEGLGRAAALSRAGFVARAVAGDGVRDAGRVSRMVAMAARPQALRYVRMLNGKSCARCAVLAGRRYRVSAFQRHPGCDCFHVPIAEADRDWTTDPELYFRSLSEAEQDATFGKAAAEALRLSKNVEVTMGQVVNAQSGMTTVTSFGRDLEVTTTGTSVRGLAGSLLRAEQGVTRQVIGTTADGAPRTLRFANAPRLMPDEIFRLAESEGWDRAELIRQLTRFAYLV